MTMNLLFLLVLLFSVALFAVANDDRGNNNSNYRSKSKEQATLLRIVQEELPIVPNGKRFYTFKRFLGQGPLWQVIDGVGCVVVPNHTALFSVIYQNELFEGDEPVIIHAHGLTPPSVLDGAPYISSLPLEPGRQQLIEYPLLPHNTGTSFLHSHYSLQLGDGLAAPLIVQGVPSASYPLYRELLSAQESVMFLQDVCPYTLDESQRALKQKWFPHANTPSIYRKLFGKAGGGGDPRVCNQQAVYEFLKETYENETKPFPECPDVEEANSHDVFYDALIANGRSLQDPIKVKVNYGKYARVRIINASGMTSYRIVVPPELVQRTYIVAVDGQLIHPLQLESFWLTNAQRADLLIRVPERSEMDVDTVFPILAISEGNDFSQQAGIILYPQASYPVHVPNPPVISTRVVGFMNNREEMLMHAWDPLPVRPVDKVFDLKLTGDNGFDSINGKSYQMVPEAPYQRNPDPLRVKLGQRIQVNFLNNNQDGHPMHLHGHRFQVVAIDGKKLVNGAVRDTVIVQGGCHSVSVVFDADNAGSWLLHCHMEFHLAAGMATTVEYYDKPKAKHVGW